MAGNKGNPNKTQGGVAKPSAPPTQAKPIPGTGGAPANVTPKPPLGTQTNPPTAAPSGQKPAPQTPGPQTPVPQTPAPQTPASQTPAPQPNPNPQAGGGGFAGTRDPRVLPIPINTPAVAGTFIDRTLNDAVRKVFRGTVNERSATEIFEKLSQIAPLTPGRTGPQSEFSASSSSGGTSIAGQSVAQMSLFERAHAALADAEKRLGALKPMQTPTDPENLDALRTITLGTYKRLVNELGRSGGPRSDRAVGYFAVLLGDPPAAPALGPKSLLGKIQDQFKLNSGINSQEDSANVANFSIVRDNLFDVHRSWTAFTRDRQQDFSERAARFSRFLVMIQDDVADVETAMDEINFDATDRESHEISGALTITIQGLLSWITEFAAEEGPEMVDEGGMLGIAATLPTVTALQALVEELRELDESFVKDSIVQASLVTLEDHLEEAELLVQQIDAKVNPAQP